MENQDLYKFGGRTFRPIKKTTLECDGFQAVQLDRSGLSDFRPKDGESTEAFGRRLLLAMMAAGGATYELLGALIIESHLEDRAWTPEMAKATAAMIRILDDEAEKQEAQRLLITLLMSLFREGLRSMNASRTASAALTQSQTEVSANAGA